MLTISTVISTAIIALLSGVLITLLVIAVLKKRRMAQRAPLVTKLQPMQNAVDQIFNMLQDSNFITLRNAVKNDWPIRAGLPLGFLRKEDMNFWSPSPASLEKPVTVTPQNIGTIFNQAKKSLTEMESPLNMMDILPHMTMDQLENLPPTPLPKHLPQFTPSVLERFVFLKEDLNPEELPIYMYPSVISYANINPIGINNKMILIKYSPQFELGNPETNHAIMEAQEQLALELDTFLRKTIAKVFSDDTLKLFIDTQGVLPKTDIEMLFESPSKKTVRVIFNGSEIGKASFVTSLIEKADGNKVLETIISEAPESELFKKPTI